MWLARTLCVLLIWSHFVVIDLSAAIDRYTTCKLSAWATGFKPHQVHCSNCNAWQSNNWGTAVGTPVDGCTVTGTSWQASLQGTLFKLTYERSDITNGSNGQHLQFRFQHIALMYYTSNLRSMCWNLSWIWCPISPFIPLFQLLDWTTLLTWSMNVPSTMYNASFRWHIIAQPCEHSSLYIPCQLSQDWMIAYRTILRKLM